MFTIEYIHCSGMTRSQVVVPVTHTKLALQGFEVVQAAANLHSPSIVKPEIKTVDVQVTANNSYIYWGFIFVYIVYMVTS